MNRMQADAKEWEQERSNRVGSSREQDVRDQERDMKEKSREFN